MLTRHFYEVDEVCFALLDCLRYKKIEEAVFWTRELILSGEHDELEKTVIQGWIIYLGVLHVNWLDLWFVESADDLEGYKRLAMIVEFCKTDVDKKKKMPSTALTFWIAGRGFAPEASEERVSLALTENDPICLYWWMGSSYEKKPTALLETIKTYVDSVSIFDSISKAMALKVSLQMRILLSVCAVQILCLDIYPADHVIQDSTKTYLNSLDDKWYVGFRSSRLYAISNDVLPKGYKRVLQETALCCSPIELLENGCAFWKSIRNQIVDDDSLENIVEKYFPDDIPDEWSIEDRAYSHVLKLDAYKINIRPEYRMKKIWNATCVIAMDWYPHIKSLFKACRVPDP